MQWFMAYTLIKPNTNFNFQLPFRFVFFTSHRNGLTKKFSSYKYLSEHKISWSHVELVQVLHSPQKFEMSAILNDWSYRIKIYGF